MKIILQSAFCFVSQCCPQMCACGRSKILLCLWDGINRFILNLFIFTPKDTNMAFWRDSFRWVWTPFLCTLAHKGDGNTLNQEKVKKKFWILNKMLIGSDRIFGNQFSLGCISQGHSTRHIPDFH